MVTKSCMDWSVVGDALVESCCGQSQETTLSGYLALLVPGAVGRMGELVVDTNAYKKIIGI